MTGNLEQDVAAARTRLQQLTQIRADALKSAEAHENAARADRLTASNAKDEMAQLNLVLQHAGVQSEIQQARAAAQSAQADAQKAKEEQEATSKRMAEKEARLDALLAKGEAAANATPASAATEPAKA